MQVFGIQSAILFKRRLKPSEEKDYAKVLSLGKEKAANGFGKSILIVPSSSLPQSSANNTGVGTIASEEGQRFLDFAKKYWGINEIQLLPMGQYHRSGNNTFPLYSSTSFELGNHVIDVKSFLPEADFKNLVKSNGGLNSVNFNNVVPLESAQEKLLEKLHNNIPESLKSEFENFKSKHLKELEPMGIYKVLLKKYGTPYVNKWKHPDEHLYNNDIISSAARNARIEELYKLYGNDIDLYYFKQFLAEKSFNDAKQKINSKGIKLNGDMLCGFSYSEKWTNPKAFLNNVENLWGAPVLNFESPEGENMLRKKVRFFAKHYDGFRVDASWTYVFPKNKNKNTGEMLPRKDWGDRFLKVIDEEVKKVKGQNYDLKNIMHEFAADSDKFLIHSYGNHLKPYVDERVKIYTSDHLSDYWGSASAFHKLGWGDRFIIGAINHDSASMEVSDIQKSALSKILKIPVKKLENKTEFIKAKLAEPLSARNNMIFFTSALGINKPFSNCSDSSKNYKIKIPENYENFYEEALQRGEGFNPMDALAKQFKAQGLDKREPELYKKILKYKKILESKENAKTIPWVKITAIVVPACLALIGLCMYCKDNYASSKYVL